MAYDPFEGFRKAASTYTGPEPSVPMPKRSFDRAKAESWVMGTEMGPPKELANTVGPPTDADRIAWAKAQEAFAHPKQTTDSFNRLLVQSAQALLPAKLAFALAPEQEKQRQIDIAGRYPLMPRSGSSGAFTDSDVGAVAALEPRPVPTPLEAGPMLITPKLTSLGNGYGVTGSNTSGRAGYANKTYYDPNSNVIASGLSSATGRGGFGGAATDAEADRNLKARLAQDEAARTMAASMNRSAEAMRELRAAQIADFDGYKLETPAMPGLDQQKFNYQQNIDANRFLLDKQKFGYQQELDKQRLAVDKSEAESKQAGQQLARQKYMDESRKAFASEFSFSDPKAPREQIAGAVFDISQATGVPTDVVSQIYEQTVKELGIDYGKGGPKSPMDLNKLVAARVTQAYQGQ